MDGPFVKRFDPRFRLLLPLLLLVLVATPAAAEIDPYVVDLYSEVSTVNLNADVEYYSEQFPPESGAATRRFAASSQAWPVVTDLRDRLSALGWETGLQEFSFEHDTLGVVTSWNVIARKRGVNPDAMVILGAHWDSIDDHPGGSYDDPEAPAPGADDNGSGVAALLEIARITADEAFSQHIELVFFGSEEVQLQGSKHYVEQLVELGLHEGGIAGFFNVDTIGYDSDAWDFVVLHDASSTWLKNKVMQWVGDYGPDVGLDAEGWFIESGWSNSDVHWFWQYGIPGVSIWEGHWAFNDHAPYGNDANDTYNNCISDFGQFLTAMTQFTLVILCEWGYISEDWVGVADLPSAGTDAISAYPNPFHESTAIRFLRPDGAPATALEIFDVRGRRLRSLDPGGEGSVIWDGRDDRGEALPSGVYLVRAAGESGGGTAERVVLLR